MSDNSWNSGRWYDTLLATFYPMDINLGTPAQANASPFGYYAITAATSQHPGGCNFAFCDGSVNCGEIQLLDDRRLPDGALMRVIRLLARRSISNSQRRR